MSEIIKINRFPLDVNWVVCSNDCPLTKIKGLKFTIETARICDESDRINCRNLSDNIAVQNTSNDIFTLRKHH